MPAKFWTPHTIQTELKTVVEQLGHMPCRRELEELNRGDLSKAIQKNGGFRRWASAIGIEPTSTSWSRSKIQQGILDNLVDGRMPTSNELSSIGLSNLSNAIIRSGGFKHWQQTLGLANKQSETHIGQEWEEWAREHLSQHGMTVEQMPTRHPFDLMVTSPTTARVDVKSSHPHNYGSVRGHIFGINKPHEHDCDIYMLICLSDDDEPIAVYYIPAKYAPKTTITITHNGKYSLFKDNLSVFSLI